MQPHRSDWCWCSSACFCTSARRADANVAMAAMNHGDASPDRYPQGQVTAVCYLSYVFGGVRLGYYIGRLPKLNRHHLNNCCAALYVCRPHALFVTIRIGNPSVNNIGAIHSLQHTVTYIACRLLTPGTPSHLRYMMMMSTTSAWLSIQSQWLDSPSARVVHLPVCSCCLMQCHTHITTCSHQLGRTYY